MKEKVEKEKGSDYPAVGQKLIYAGELMLRWSVGASRAVSSIGQFQCFLWLFRKELVLIIYVVVFVWQ